MIYSQTGFGHGEYTSGELRYTAEIRSVNSRYLEINFRLPRSLAMWESELRKLVKAKVNRGKLLVFLSESKDSIRVSSYGFDVQRVNDLLRQLRELGRSTGLKDDLGLSDLPAFAEWLTPGEDDESAEERLEVARKAVEAALEEFIRTSAEEGTNLAQDLRERLENIAGLVELVEQKASENRDLMFERLQERIEVYITDDALDQTRLEQEAALLIDRMDITEEIVRMKSHLQLFQSALDNGGMVGKRLNFLLQEMNREVNTMGSKAAAPEISGWIVEMKEDLEKMREQVQNVA